MLKTLFELIVYNYAVFISVLVWLYKNFFIFKIKLLCIFETLYECNFKTIKY